MSTGNETLLTHAALDGELDAAGMLDFENRLAANASLAAEYGRLKALREVMRRQLVKPVAPPALRQRIAAMAARSSGARPARAPWQAMAASAILAAGLGSASTWLALRPAIQDTDLAGTLVADHKRGLLSGQPADVASSDRHTVKPWFATRFALAPKVVDLGPQGFPLAGGRIDIIAGAPAPVLIYRHNEHFISLTALPAEGSPPAGAFVVAGYSVQVWRDGGTEYWAISDIDPAELANFRQLFDTAAKSGPEKTG
ncbi:MAG TPA: anti-sigma factor [Methylocella sp.]|nr:anti-sigma factor [Methylocella sp.]